MRSPSRSRFERDSLGVREIPSDVYWGIHTLRALEGFPITCTQISSHPELVTALAQIKRASSLARFDPGLMDEAKKTAIVQACREIEQGRLLDQFVVDVLQCGAAASANANANEVIANRALEILGHDRGAYSVIHPHHDLDTGLSAKDVHSTAIRLAAIRRTDELLSAMADLRQGLASKALEAKECRIRGALGDLCRIRPATTCDGGTASHPGWAAAYHAHLQRITGLPLTAEDDPAEKTSDCGGLVLLSGAITHAAAGLSSIVAGLVEPAVAEVVDQVAFEVLGNDLTIRLAAEAGRRTAFEPVIAEALFRSLSRLTSACMAVAEQTPSPALKTVPLLTRN
ncbi:lyase family protein [Sinomonas mesophila]|uniref:lyase family protein n=1 Tax=Sinomonas mesophila TaxID=1531955 RepID=UPI00158F2854|nr:lyase family protein [Sinomonas mesophila]